MKAKPPATFPQFQQRNERKRHYTRPLHNDHLSTAERFYDASKTVREGSHLEPKLTPSHPVSPPKTVIPFSPLRNQFHRFCRASEEIPSLQMGRLAVKQILRVPKYIGEMLIVRNQEQLTPRHARTTTRYGSPFELNLAGWSRSDLKPSIRELVEGPLLTQDSSETGSRFGRVGTDHRIDLKKARSRAKYFTHITAMTGGLFSNWKQVSKTAAVYRDYLHHRMEYELDAPPSFLPDTGFVANNVIQQRAIDLLLAKSRRKDKEGTGRSSGMSRLSKVHRRLHCLIDETKVISKKRFVELDAMLKHFPL